MGFLSRTFVPRSVRRAIHPVRNAKRVVRKAVVPKSIRKVSYGVHQAAHPIESIKYHALERPITTAIRSGSRKSSSRTKAPAAPKPAPKPVQQQLAATQPSAEQTPAPSTKIGLFWWLLFAAFFLAPVFLVINQFRTGNWWNMAGLVVWIIVFRFFKS